MDEIWARVLDNMSSRISGPMNLRLLLQPIMATIFAIIAGLRDARVGNRPYFWAVVTDPANRADMIRDGWKSVGKVFVLALVLDAIFQVVFLRVFYPGETIIVAFCLAIVPYLLIRGLTTRLTRGR